jgi:hypothetical protein
LSRQLVTVKTITAQLRELGRVELRSDALITPAARDRLQSSGLQVTWLDRAPAEPERVALYLVGDGANPVCQTLQLNLERSLGPVRFWSCQGHRAGLLAALRHATDALAKCSRRRAAVVVRDGGLVACVANRQPHVRAVVCGQPTRLAGYMRDLAVNLLVLESDRLALRQMQGMLETFARGATALDPVVAEALAVKQIEAEWQVEAECRCRDARG